MGTPAYPQFSSCHTLAPGHELRCPHCGRWHTITKYPGTEGTAYTLEMLFFECKKGRYYAGQIAGASRFPTRQRAAEGHA